MRYIPFLASFLFGQDLPHKVDLGPAPSPLHLKIDHTPSLLRWDFSCSTLTTFEPASLPRGDLDPESR